MRTESPVSREEPNAWFHHARALSNSPRRYAASPPAISESMAAVSEGEGAPAARSPGPHAASVSHRKTECARDDGLVVHSPTWNRRTPLVAETPSLLSASTYQK